MGGEQVTGDEMRFLRRLEGLKKLDRVRNVDIRQRLRQEAVVEVARMKQSIEGGSRWHGRGRLVKRVHSKEVIGRRPTGKPRKGWKDNFK